MSDTGSSDAIAAGTVRVMEHMTPGAGPGSREHDGRDAGDVESARAGVDLLFASVAMGLCPEDALLAPDRDRLLWGAVEQFRSHVGRLEAQLDTRLKPRQPEQGEERDRDAGADIDSGDEEFLRAEQAEGIQRQIEVLRGALDHALMRYGEIVGSPWLVRHDSLDMQGSEQELGAQIDAGAFLAARSLWQPASDALTRVREAILESPAIRRRIVLAPWNAPGSASLSDKVHMPQPFPVARTVRRAFRLETGSGAGVADIVDGPDLNLLKPGDTRRPCRDARRPKTSVHSATARPASLRKGAHRPVSPVQYVRGLSEIPVRTRSCRRSSSETLRNLPGVRRRSR